MAHCTRIWTSTFYLVIIICSICLESSFGSNDGGNQQTSQSVNGQIEIAAGSNAHTNENTVKDDRNTDPNVQGQQSEHHERDKYNAANVDIAGEAQSEQVNEGGGTCEASATDDASCANQVNDKVSQDSADKQQADSEQNTMDNSESTNENDILSKGRSQSQPQQDSNGASDDTEPISNKGYLSFLPDLFSRQAKEQTDKLEEHAKKLKDLKTFTANIDASQNTLRTNLKVTDGKIEQVESQLQMHHTEIESVKAVAKETSQSLIDFQTMIQRESENKKKEDEIKHNQLHTEIKQIEVNINSKVDKIDIKLKDNSDQMQNKFEELIAPVDKRFTQSVGSLKDEMKNLTSTVEQHKQQHDEDVSKLREMVTDVESKLQMHHTEIESVKAVAKETSQSLIDFQTMIQRESENKKKEDEIKHNQLHTEIKQIEVNINSKVDKIDIKLKDNSDQMQNKFEELIAPVDKRFTQSVGSLKDEMKNLTSTVEQHKQQHDEDVSKLREMVTDVESKFNERSNILEQSLHQEISTKYDQVDGLVKSVEGKHSQLKVDTDNKFTSTESKIKDVGNQFETSISEWGNKLNSELEAVRSKHQEMEDKSQKSIEDLNQRIDRLDQSLNEKETMFRDKIKEAEDKLSDRMKEVDAKIKASESELKDLESRRQDMTELIDKQQQLLTLIHANTFNKEAVIWAALILTFLVITNMVITYAIIRYNTVKTPNRSSLTGDSTNNRFSISETSKSIIDRVPSAPTLQPTVCIVSYGQDRLQFNSKLVNSAMSLLPQSSQLTVRNHVVNDHPDIPDLPRCKLIIMCVEFSERHVIIEEQGIGLGDIRLTTYTAIQKIGANLVILYVKDPESRRLRQEQLYNPDIYCVETQEQLISLNQAGRFFSTYDRLTEFQRQQLAGVITECCKTG